MIKKGRKLVHLIVL
uniref:Uncharacterized protein n=1 Tax=Rhizophora mucronata TaxID=61149 RepID=A0A2P2PQQ3_RHIMU